MKRSLGAGWPTLSPAFGEGWDGPMLNKNVDPFARFWRRVGHSLYLLALGSSAG
jgi:hypothetical protein